MREEVASAHTAGEALLAAAPALPWPVHPLAARFFPMMETAALADDMAANGQHHPIVLFEGHILDGRNRATACQQCGITPTTWTFTGTEAEAAAFVISENLHRRHLTPRQEAFILVEYGEMFKKEAKERQMTGMSADGRAGGRGRKKTFLKICRKVCALLPPPKTPSLSRPLRRTRGNGSRGSPR